MDERGEERPMTLREWRDRRALAMADLVEQTGVAKSTIVAIEHGRVTALKRRTIRRLSEALGVDPWDVAEFRRALTEPAED
jgi:transcriptional regulator with XRE-family HTH domain